MFQVIPRDRVFYDLFERAADNVAAAARELLVLVEDLAGAGPSRDRIVALEHAGDELTHEIMARVNTTFVTPLDREDIYSLASTLDDIIDSIQAVADLLVLHHITEPLPGLRLHADALVRATEAVCHAVGELETREDMAQYWSEIVRIEKEGDRIYRRAVADLFSGEYKAMDVLKWKDIVGEMESALDRCEDIANLMESIALRYD